MIKKLAFWLAYPVDILVAVHLPPILRQVFASFGCRIPFCPKLPLFQSHALNTYGKSFIMWMTPKVNQVNVFDICLTRINKLQCSNQIFSPNLHWKGQKMWNFVTSFSISILQDVSKLKYFVMIIIRKIHELFCFVHYCW